MTDRFWAPGSEGASSGANTATNTNRPISTRPITELGLRSNRCRASAQRPTIWSRSTWSSWVSASVRLIACSPHPDPRVEPGVGDVHHQVDQHEDDGDEQDPRLQHGVVPEVDGLVHPA